MCQAILGTLHVPNCCFPPTIGPWGPRVDGAATLHVHRRQWICVRRTKGGQALLCRWAARVSFCSRCCYGLSSKQVIGAKEVGRGLCILELTAPCRGPGTRPEELQGAEPLGAELCWVKHVVSRSQERK